MGDSIQFSFIYKCRTFPWSLCLFKLRDIRQQTRNSNCWRARVRKNRYTSFEKLHVCIHTPELAPRSSMEGNPNLLWDGFDRFALGSDVLIAPRQPANFYPYNFSSDGTADLTCPVQSPGEDKFVSPPQGPQYEVQISIQELLCNRLQWYYVTCKFVSPQVK